MAVRLYWVGVGVLHKDENRIIMIIIRNETKWTTKKRKKKNHVGDFLFICLFELDMNVE